MSLCLLAGFGVRIRGYNATGLLLVNTVRQKNGDRNIRYGLAADFYFPVPIVLSVCLDIVWAKQKVCVLLAQGLQVAISSRRLHELETCAACDQQSARGQAQSKTCRAIVAV